MWGFVIGIGILIAVCVALVVMVAWAAVERAARAMWHWMRADL